MTSLIHLNLLVDILLKSYFFNSRCILVFTDRSNNIDLKTNLPIIYMNVYKNALNSHLIFRHYGCQDIIIQHENATQLFIQFEKLIRFNNERFNMRRYVVIGKDAWNIFDANELDYVCNLLVVIPIYLDNKGGNPINGDRFQKEIYQLVTHFYGDRTHGSGPKILDKWFSENCSFLYGNDLFPDKLRDQNGRQLRIGTFTYEPYSIVGDDNKTFHGTETSFVLEFAKKHNLTPTFTIIGDDFWGEIYANWTGIGLMGSLVEDIVDIGYAAIYTWEEYYNFLDYTKPLTRTGVTCLVPAPQLSAGWLTPLYSFSLEMWVAVLVIFSFNTLVLIFLLSPNEKLTRNFDDSLMTMVRVHLLQSLTLAMNSRLIKYFIALNLVYVLLLSSSYSSGLASVMTVPRYDKAIDTVQDLASSGLPWGAPTDAWLISLRGVDAEDYKIIKNNFVIKNEDDLVKSSKRHDFGFSLERLPYGHFAVGPYVKRDVISNYRIMQQDIYWEQCIFMIRKNSVLLPLLDDLILKVFEAGLGAYWENHVVSRYMDTFVQRGIMYYLQEHGTVKLKWMHVEGAFGILMIGYGASTVTFVAEILTHSRIKIVN